MDDVANEASQSSDDTSAAAIGTDQTGQDDFDAVKVTQTLQEQLQLLESYTDESKLLDTLVAINEVLTEFPGLTDQSDFEVSPENYDKLLQLAFDAAVHVKVISVIKKYITPDLKHDKLSSQQSCVLVEAFWILTNLASGTEKQTKLVTDAGVIPIVLATFMKSEQRFVFNHCIGLITNLVVVPQTRILVPVRSDLVEKSLKMLQRARTHAQECGPNTDSIEHVARILCFFSTLLHAEVDVCSRLNQKVVHTACATLMEFGDSCTEILTGAIDVIYRASNVMPPYTFGPILIANGYVPLIVKYMMNENLDVRADAIGIVGTLMMSPDDVTTSIMRSSVSNHVSHLLLTDEETINQVAWMMSYAVAGTESMTNIVFDHNILPLVVSLLQSSCCDVVVNSLCVVNNLVNHMSDEQRWHLFEHDRHDVLSTVIPLLSAELCKQKPSERVTNLLFDMFMQILVCLMGFDRDVSDLYAMFKDEMEKDIYSQLDENFRYGTHRIVSFLKRLEQQNERKSFVM